MTGGACSLTVTIPADGFEVTRGEPVIGGLDDARHHHCNACKSWVFTRVPAMDWLVHLRATMLDDCRWFVPFIELWTDERLPTATTGPLCRFPQEPELEQFPTLMAQFAAEGVRP